MRRWIAITIFAVCGTFVLGLASSFAQDSQDDSARKVVSRVLPTFPPVARKMGIKGSVKVEAVVAPNGTVKSLEVKGGHPLLVQAATDAVRKWKWVPAARESREPVTVKFDPSE
jgi:TonB family protein